jgi:hypothetical protein
MAGRRTAPAQPGGSGKRLVGRVDQLIAADAIPELACSSEIDSRGPAWKMCLAM